MPHTRDGKTARRSPSLTFRPRRHQEDIARWIDDHKTRGDLPEAMATAIRLHIFMERHQEGEGGRAEVYAPLNGQLRMVIESVTPALAQRLAEELLQRMPQLGVATPSSGAQDPAPPPLDGADERSRILQERFLASSGLLEEDDD